MALLKSINENHDKLPDDVFWNKETWEDFKHKPPNSWTRLTHDILIRYIEKIDTKEDILSILSEEQASEKGTYHLNVINSSDLDEDKWVTTIFEHYNNQIKSKEFKLEGLQYFKFSTSKDIIQPFKIEMSRFNKIFNSKMMRIKRKHTLLNDSLFILENHISDKPLDILLKQAKEKNISKYNSRISRLEKAEYDMSNIMEMGYANIRRNHYSVNSNFSKSGKIIVTDEHIILTRKKFRLFGISLLSLVPLLAFVRPANKIILLARIFMQYLRIPLQLLKGLRPILSAALGGVLISGSFVNFDKVNSFLDRIGNISWLAPFSFGLNFFVENPEAIPVALGVFTGLRFVFPRLLPRREELVILPHESCEMLIAEGSELIGRWSIKGSKTVNATRGLQLRIALRDFNSGKDHYAHQRLAMNVFNIILGDIPKNVDERSVAPAHNEQ